MVEYSEYEIEEFSENLFEEFQERREISRLAQVEDFSEQRDGDKEFVQIGRRYSELQGEWFHDDTGDTHYARNPMPRQISREIALGELNHVIERLKELSESGDITRTSIEKFTFKDLCRAMLKFEEITHLIVPNEYRSELSDWCYKSGLIKKMEDPNRFHYLFPGGVKIVFGNKNSEMGDNIFAINKNQLKIIQKKRFNKDLNDVESELDMGLIPDYRELGEDRELMLYFGKSNEGDLDFLYRTIIHVEKPDKKSSIGAIQLP